MDVQPACLWRPGRPYAQDGCFCNVSPRALALNAACSHLAKTAGNAGSCATSTTGPSQPRQLKLWQLPDSRAGFELTQIHEISLGSEEIERNTYPREGTDRYCHERHNKGPRVQVNNPSQPQKTVCKSLWAFEIHAPIQVVFLVFNRMEVACTLYP